MWQKQIHKSSFRESIQALEADIQNANTLAAALPRDYVGDCIQMKMSYSPFAPFLIFLVEWMDYRCTDTLPTCLGLLHILVYKVYADGMTTMSSQERKATLREFYSVIYPSLQQLEGDLELMEVDNQRTQTSETLSRKKMKEDRKISDRDTENDEECGICMETCTKMVLPNCGHSMCINCFNEWHSRSQSCPFCRGGLRRVSSKDLWVLTGKNDIVDTLTLAKENLSRFYLYIENLPAIVSETHLLLYDYLI